jgi:hypothetical protein
VQERQFSDAFHWLADNMVDAIECPDEHFDWVYMLRPVDWDELARIYPEKPLRWREAWAYVVAQGPASEALKVLGTAIRDPEPNVSLQAALSVVDLHRLFPEVVRISGSLLRSLREVAERADGSVDEVRAFLAGSGGSAAEAD